MGRNPQKKERRRLKRQRKQRETRRAQSGSPYRRIGDRGEVEACYVNRDWQEGGIASICCLRRVPGGGHAMAAFLVDLWCTGLKDAWGRLSITAEEFQDKVVGHMSEIMEIERIDVEVARRIVAGGVRFADRNGFRLPRRCERWVSLLGGVGDVDLADLSDFGKDGQLCYVGSMEDLEKRLIRGSVDKFLAREDVHYIIGEEGFAPPDEDEDETVVEETIDVLRENGVDAVRQWCFAQGMRPHPRLAEAWDITFAAISQLESVPEDEDEEDGEEVDLTEEQYETLFDNLDRFLSFESPEDERGIMEALGQLQAYMETLGSPEALFEMLGAGVEELDDER